MNFLDIILLIPLLYGLIIGLKNGLVREMATIIGIVIGIYFARFLSDDLATLMVETLGWKVTVCIPLAFALIFILVMLIFLLTSSLIKKMLKKIKLGGLNRVLGAIFGVAKYALILSIIINFLALVKVFIPFSDKPAVKQSKLYTPIQKIVPNVLPLIKFDDYKAKAQELLDVDHQPSKHKKTV